MFTYDYTVVPVLVLRKVIRFIHSLPSRNSVMWEEIPFPFCEAGMPTGKTIFPFSTPRDLKLISTGVASYID